eukprot:7384687-Prymnesium_polylepis.1
MSSATRTLACTASSTTSTHPVSVSLRHISSGSHQKAFISFAREEGRRAAQRRGDVRAERVAARHQE